MKKKHTIAHLSDLHLTSNNEEKRKEDNKHNMNYNLVRILKHSSVQDADVVVITGDITDKGELAAWNYFWSSVKNASLNRKKILVIHGNHVVACLDYRQRKVNSFFLFLPSSSVLGLLI